MPGNNLRAFNCVGGSLQPWHQGDNEQGEDAQAAYLWKLIDFVKCIDLLKLVYVVKLIDLVKFADFSKLVVLVKLLIYGINKFSKNNRFSKF